MKIELTERTWWGSVRRGLFVCVILTSSIACPPSPWTEPDELGADPGEPDTDEPFVEPDDSDEPDAGVPDANPDTPDPNPTPSTWSVDTQHRLVWTDSTYIPYNSFATGMPDATRSVSDRHFWVDTDVGNPTGDPVFVNNMTDTFMAQGETWTALLLTKSPPNNDASRLFDAAVKQDIVDSWRPFGSAIAKSGLRAILLFNEINIEWTWPATHTATEYGHVLAEYATAAKTIFGDVPILFKVVPFGILDAEGNSEKVIAALAFDDVAGIGIDHYSPSCTTADRFAEAALVVQQVNALGRNRLIWATEFGSGAQAGVVEPFTCYWDEYPPFVSESDLNCQLDALVNTGVTGFILAAPADGAMEAECSHLNYSQNISWFFSHQSAAIAAINAR